MGFFANLFGIVLPEQPPQLQSIFPDGAANKIRNGILPVISADKLVLGQNEVCHFVEMAAAVTERKRYKSVRSGGSYRIFKGYTAHIGQSQTVPVSEPQYTKGIFYITNQRAVFVAQKNGFDKKISKLTAVTPYADGISLQFGDKTYSLLLPDGILPKSVLSLIIGGHI